MYTLKGIRAHYLLFKKGGEKHHEIEDDDRAKGVMKVTGVLLNEIDYLKRQLAKADGRLATAYEEIAVWNKEADANE